ncbi:MAG: hypothetical protein AB8B97_26305 [Granulosicoccus sp.]
MGDFLHMLVAMYLIGTIPALLVFLFRPPEQKELTRTMRQSVKYIAWEAMYTVFLWPYALHRYVNRRR